MLPRPRTRTHTPPGAPAPSLSPSRPPLAPSPAHLSPGTHARTRSGSRAPSAPAHPPALARSSGSGGDGAEGPALSHQAEVSSVIAIKQTVHTTN